MATNFFDNTTGPGTGEWTAPVAEYDFLLREAFGKDLMARVTQGEMTADDAADILTGAAEFSERVFAPLDRLGDQQGAMLVDGQVITPAGFAEAYQLFVEAGWVTASAPASAGGDELPGVIQAALSEFWNGANAALALNPALNAGAIRALDATVSDQLRETYLSRMVSGQWTGTMNLTEPQAGSDLGAIRTMAREQPDGSWLIRGQKIFITWGDHDVAENIVHLVLARTEGAPAGHRGISLFVVPKFLVNTDGTLGQRNMITTVSLERKLGIHASPTCMLEYDDAVGYLAGELHQGLAGMFVMMNSARLGMAFQGLGIAERALQRARHYASERVQGAVLGQPDGAPIARHPDVHRELLSMSSSVSAMRALAVYIGGQQDEAASGSVSSSAAQARVDLSVPILKTWFSEESVRIASEALQVHGGAGYIEETGAAQQYRDARILPIYEGTSAIQANDLVGRKVLRDGGQAMFAVLDDVASEIDLLATQQHPVAQRLAQRLQRALVGGRAATDALLGFSDSPRSAYAVGVPYTRMMGLLWSGWMHAVLVNAVLERDVPGSDGERRLLEAEFFGTAHLPHVLALAETVAAGESSIA